MALHGLDRPVVDNTALLVSGRGTCVRPHLFASRAAHLGRAWLYCILPVFLPGMRMLAPQNRGGILQRPSPLAEQEMLSMRAGSHDLAQAGRTARFPHHLDRINAQA